MCSRIYINFDLQISPNSLALIIVVIHYLNRDLKARSYLISLRRIKGAHSDKNIAEVIISMLGEIDIILLKLGFFIYDNAINNDTCIRTICQQLNIKNADSRRVQYLEYIINLAVKAFLFGDDVDVFKLTINNTR